MSGIIERIIDAQYEYDAAHYRASDSVFLSDEHRRELRAEFNNATAPFNARDARQAEELEVVCGLEIYRQEDDQPSPLVGRIEYGRHGERYLY